MFARVARFEGADLDRLQAEAASRQEPSDLPEGLRRVIVLADRASGEHLFVTFFDSADAIAAAEARFEQMGDEIPESVRGRRVAVGVYEVVLDRES